VKIVPEDGPATLPSRELVDLSLLPPLPMRLKRFWIERAPHGQFWSLALATILFNTGVSVFFFLYNLFMFDMGFRERSLGVVAGAMALGSVAGTIPVGMAARRLGPRRILTVCLLGIAVAFGARVWLLWYPAQLAFSFLDGVMLCGWVVCLAPAVADSVEERKRPFAFSLLFAAAVAAGSLGGFFGGHLPGWCMNLSAGHFVPIAGGKRMALLAACVLTGLAALPVTRLRGGAPIQTPARWLARPDPFLMKFLLASACWAAVLGAFNPFTNLFFVHHVGVPAARLGNFFSVAQLLQAVAVLSMPLILRRTGLVPGIVAAQLATAAGLACLAAGRSAIEAEVAYCGFMAAQHMCDPGVQSLLMKQVAAEERSSATALYFLAISLAQAAGAGVAGIAFARFGYPRVLAALTAGAVGAAALFWGLCGPARAGIDRPAGSA
jgi:MFS family permease